MIPLANALVGALTLLATVNAECLRGVPWAVDNRYAKAFGVLPKIKWYHHWADGPVPEMGSKNEFVPMYWGPAQTGKWNTRVAEINKNTPKHILAFNEPDLTSQANMSPSYAAQLYADQIFWKFQSKGVRFGSPSIAFNLDWMGNFLNEAKKRNARVDFVCVHWYGSWNDVEKFKQYIIQSHNRFGKNIWITEVGITTASNPSTAQVKNFMMNAVSWLDTQPYVERVAWFGAFQTNAPPDSFATGKNGLFQPGGALTDIAYWYGYSSKPGRRSAHARHHLLDRDVSNSDAAPGVEAVHCDELCQLRNAQLERYEKDAKRTEIDARAPEADAPVPADAM